MFSLKQDSELSRLHALYERGLQNGVPGLSLIDRARIKELEPLIDGIQAIHSPNTGCAPLP
jgi:L-2-hydroxyglutarate oxidase LhgO